MSAAESLEARIHALRSKGPARADAVRLLQLQALSRRLAGQPSPVQALLRAKVEAALADIAQRIENAPAQVAPRPAQRPAAPAWPRARDASGELASATRFRRVWSRTRAQDSVSQAAAQRPANAGPLNSHVLVLQAMDRMAQLSPDYLRRFVAHAESLLWLEDVPTRSAAAATRKPKRRR
jgi:hypothetical protein